MRISPVLFVVFVATAKMGAAPRHRAWVPGTLGIVTTDDWCKAPSGSRGSCGQPMDYGPSQQMRSDIDAPSLTVGTPAIPNPVTQIIKVEGANASYIVKYETLLRRIKSVPNAPVEFAIEGRHLFLRLSGSEYKTDIRATNKPKP